MFVEAYVDYVLNKSVEQVFNEFKKGFYKVCDRNMVNIFQPEELQGVMMGSEEYDWDTFKQVNTSTTSFIKAENYIVMILKLTSTRYSRLCFFTMNRMQLMKADFIQTTQRLLHSGKCLMNSQTRTRKPSSVSLLNNYMWVCFRKTRVIPLSSSVKSIYLVSRKVECMHFLSSLNKVMVVWKWVTVTNPVSFWKLKVLFLCSYT